jgi:hypothetical protein
VSGTRGEIDDEEYRQCRVTLREQRRHGSPDGTTSDPPVPPGGSPRVLLSLSLNLRSRLGLLSVAELLSVFPDTERLVALG